jgi:hypothetical protein
MWRRLTFCSINIVTSVKKSNLANALYLKKWEEKSEEKEQDEKYREEEHKNYKRGWRSYEEEVEEIMWSMMKMVTKWKYE